VLRFFRKYNKFILAVFGTGLMVVFLIEPAMQGCGRGQADALIGMIGDRPLNRTDQIRAQGQLQALAELSRLKRLPPSIFDGGDLLSWVLMVEEARTMGLSASQRDVDQLLRDFGIGEGDLRQVARSLQLSPLFVHEAVRDWSMVQTYKTLVRGAAPVSLENRPGRYAASVIAGDPPLSAPLVERFVFGLRSTVKISTTVLSHLQLDNVDDPDPQEVQELFDQFKDSMAGESEPYGFGYRLPNRVRLEYLACRVADLSDAVEVSEREALKYYETHPDKFLAPAVEEPAENSREGAGESNPRQGGVDALPPKRVMPYRKIRDRVRVALRKQNAGRLANQVMAFARRRLNEQIESLPLEEGIRRLPAEFEPLALDEIRKQIRSKFGVDVTVHPDDGSWLSRAQLRELEGIGDAFVRRKGRRGQRASIGFADYALVVRPLKPPDGGAVSLSLDLNLPSLMLETDDSRFLFRVTAAANAVSPTFETSRPEVIRDARKLKAYKQLVADKDRWVERAEIKTLESLAETLKTTVNESQTFPRREWFFGFRVPNVDRIGRDEAFIDHVFDVVARDATASTASAPAKIIAAPIPRMLSLILVRIEQFNPVPRSAFEKMARSDELGLIVGLYLADDPQFDPLSIEAIKSRVGFKEAQ